MSKPRVVVILGSGETAASMVSLHRSVLARLDASATAVMLDTPFGFQENADDLSAKIREYYSTRLGRDLEVAMLRDANTAPAIERERFEAAVESADYVFAGPGSPSYALRHWQQTELAELLRAKVRDGGVLVFASAAAITLGVASLPVYEIYKVGDPCHWLPGLDVLAEAGIRAAVVPHYDNHEGSGHDTRFCYMGERRLEFLEAQLDNGTLVLGVDEHTAVILDLDAKTVQVRGRGALTLRRGGVSTVVAAGASIGLDELRDRGAEAPPRSAADTVVVQPEVSLAAAAIDAGLEQGDVDAVIAGLLELDQAAARDSADAAQARALLRRRIVRLGELGVRGPNALRESVAPFVDALLTLRGRARSARRFDEADGVRELLTACGVEVRDTPDGAEWSVSGE